MKKLLAYIFLAFFCYIQWCHNTAVAFFVQIENSKQESQEHCHTQHSEAQSHKCCFISDDNTPKLLQNIQNIESEKSQKKFFSVSNFWEKNTQTQRILRASLIYTWPPWWDENLKQTYTSLVGIIKQLK